MPEITQHDFFTSVEIGDVRTVQNWIDQGGSIDISRPDSDTALTLAVKKKQKGMVVFLLDNGVNANRTSLYFDEYDENIHDMRTALMWAISDRDMEMTDLLITKGVDINTQNGQGWSALTYVLAHYQDTTFLEYLLELEPELNNPDSLGNFPLSHTVSHKDFDKFEMLLQAGAEPDMQDRQGNTMLIHLFQNITNMDAEQVEKFTETLLKYGADPRIENNDGENAFDVSKAYAERTNTPNSLKHIKDRFAKRAAKQKHGNFRQYLHKNHKPKHP